MLSTRQKLMMLIGAVFEVQLLPARNLLACTKICECNFDTYGKASRTKKTSAHRFSEKLLSHVLMAMWCPTQNEIRYG
jgi:hypothetical protein